MSQSYHIDGRVSSFFPLVLKSIEKKLIVESIDGINERSVVDATRQWTCVSS